MIWLWFFVCLFFWSFSPLCSQTSFFNIDLPGCGDGHVVNEVPNPIDQNVFFFLFYFFQDLQINTEKKNAQTLKTSLLQ